MADKEYRMENQVPEKSGLEAANAVEEELKQPVESAEQVNQRLLNESKKYKEQFKTVKQELDSYKKQQLEEQGRWQEIAQQKEQELQQFQEAFITEKVNASLSRAAEKSGCIDIDALMKLGDHDLLEFDEETMAIGGVDAFIENAKHKYSFLFRNTQVPQVNSMRPGGPVQEPKAYTAQDIAKIKDPKIKADLWKQAMLNNKLR